MSYEKAMKWGRRHPKGARNLFLGFDTFSGRQKSQSTLARESGATFFYVTSRKTIRDREEKHPDNFTTQDEAVDFITNKDPQDYLCWRIYNNLGWLVSGW